MHQQHCTALHAVLPAPTPRSRWLKASNTLSHLELRGCELGPGAMAAMCDGLAAAPALTHLDMSGNKLGDEGATHVRPCSQSNSV